MTTVIRKGGKNKIAKGQRKIESVLSETKEKAFFLGNQVKKFNAHFGTPAEIRSPKKALGKGSKIGGIRSPTERPAFLKLPL